MDRYDDITRHERHKISVQPAGPNEFPTAFRHRIRRQRARITGAQHAGTAVDAVRHAQPVRKDLDLEGVAWLSSLDVYRSSKHVSRAALAGAR